MRRWVITLSVAAAVAFCAWLAYSKVSQARREATYRAAITALNLSPGETRANVEKYLEFRGLKYHTISGEGDAESYLVEIGEEPGGLVCKSWKVYISLDFDGSGKPSGRPSDLHLDPSDTLRDVRIKKMGVCV
jgi:hypothetical protein